MTTMLNGLSFQNQVNALGGAAFVIIGGFFAYQLFKSRDIAPCGARYETVTQMSLQKQGGALLAPGELQARVGIGERGVLEKATVVKIEGQSPIALKVNVGGPVPADTGATFLWSPSALAKATSACLSYTVYVPDDFDYARGGRLPGLFGGTPYAAQQNAQSGFSTRFTWDQNGGMGVAANFSDIGGTAQSPEPTRFGSDALLPRGQWVQIDQEIALNAPNAQNGTLRLCKIL